MLEGDFNLASQVNIGDYVEYQYDGQTDFSTQWRVWNKQGNNITITPVKGIGSLCLGKYESDTEPKTSNPDIGKYGITGTYKDYINCAKILDEACKQKYKNTEKSINSIRSLRLDDILDKIDSDDLENIKTKTENYGKTCVDAGYNENGYTEGVFYTYENGGSTYTISDTEEPKKATADSPVIVKQSFFGNGANITKWNKSSNGVDYGTILGSGYGWLATPCLAFSSNGSLINFSVYRMSQWTLSYNAVCTEKGDRGAPNALRPLVTFSANLLDSETGDGSSSNPWKL